MASETVEIIINAKDQASAVLKGVGSGLSSVGSIALNVAKTAFVGLAAGVATVVGGLTTLVIKSAATADELVELSAKTGISTERLQELKFIGEQTGTSMETVTSSMARLVRSMDSAVTGTGDVADAFDTLGVSVTDTDGNLRDSEEVFAEIIDALGNVENETERNALAMEIFGKSAQELNPLILEGSEGLAAMAEQAHAMGAVMSEESVAGLAAFNDTLAAGKLAVQGLLGTLAGEFVPVFQGIIDFLITNGLPVFKDMATTIASFLAPAFQTVADVLAALFTGDIQAALNAMFGEEGVALFNTFTEALTPLYEAFVNLATTIISSFPQMKAQGEAFMGWIAQAFGATLPTLAANVGGIINTMTTWWEQHGATVMAVVDGTFRTILVTIGGAITLASGLINAWLTAWQGDTQGALDILQNTFHAFFESVLSLVGTNAAEFQATWTGTFELISLAFTTWANQLLLSFSTWFLDFLATWQTNLDMLSAIVSTIIGNISGFFEGLKTTISGVIATVQNLINKILAIPGIPGGESGAAGGSSGGFAQGGIVPGSYSQALPTTVHGSEMILTPGDQKNLFDLIRGGFGGGATAGLTLIINSSAPFESLIDDIALLQQMATPAG